MLSRRSAVGLGLATAATAGGIFAIDRRAAAREAQAEAEFPPIGVLLDVDGRRVHAYVAGEGPDVVLLHGAGGNLRDFTFDLTDRLRHEFRVIAFDRPGFGFSDPIDGNDDPRVQAAHLRKASAHLGVTRPIVVGHSYGGSVMMAWGSADPAGTRGLISLAGTTMPWPGGLADFYVMTGSRIGGLTMVPLMTAFASDDQAEAAIAGIFTPDPVPQGYLDYFGAGLTLRRASLRTNGRQVMALKDHLTEMSRDYGSLTMPIELIHGTADRIVYAEIHSIPLSKSLPDARLTLLEGKGHMPHHTDPEAVVAALRRIAAR